MTSEIRKPALNIEEVVVAELQGSTTTSNSATATSTHSNDGRRRLKGKVAFFFRNSLARKALNIPKTSLLTT